MDPVSQAALGAVVAHAATHRTLGARALAFGALAGVLPDLDVLLTLYGDAFDQMRLHRGITHSLFFGPVVGPVLGLLVWRWERGGGRNGDTHVLGRQNGDTHRQAGTETHTVCGRGSSRSRSPWSPTRYST